MKKLEKLTLEQESQLSVYREKWLQIGLSCEPANRETAVAGVNAAYSAAGMNPPKFIVWLDSPLSGAYGAAMLKNLPDQVRAQVRAQVGAQVRDQVWDQVRAQVGAQVRDQVWAQVGAQVGDQVWDQVRAQVGAQVYRAGYGAHDANWLGFYDFMQFVGIQDARRLNGLNLIAQSSGWFWPFENLVILTERQTVLHRDSRNRLHCEDGAAIEYKDGFKLYRWHGVNVPESVILHPEEITIDQIESEQNAEIRRVMMERYGYERYIRDCKAVVADSCAIDYPIVGLRDAKLLVKQVANDEPIVFIDLLNSTPEPDGTVKRYLMRVDPNAYGGDTMRHCQAAAASTWRDDIDGTLTFKKWKDYNPAFES